MWKPFWRKPPELGVLFVCSENVCRSPMAQAIFEDMLTLYGLHNSVLVDSAGTRVSMPGRRVDPRARVAVEQHRNIKIKRIRAREITEEDFRQFDYLLAVDSDNLRRMEYICPESCKNKLSMLLDYDHKAGISDVPDPYFGSTTGFDRVVALMEPALEELVALIRSDLEKNN